MTTRAVITLLVRYASSPLTNAVAAFLNLATCGAQLRAARKTMTYRAFLPSHPCDDRARRMLQLAARLFAGMQRGGCLVGLLALAAGEIGCRPNAAGKPGTSKVAQEVEEVVVTLAQVESRPAERMVRTVGTLRGFEEVTLTPKVEGRVQKVYHETGERVRPGELLLEIDPTDFELATQEAQQALELELARLGLSEVPPEPFDVQHLPGVERAQLLLENAARRRARAEQLRARDVTTEEQWDSVLTEHNVAEANLRQALHEARATLASARFRQATLAMAQQRLLDTRIVAPAFPSLGGEPADDAEYVIAERLVSEGEMVRAFPSTPVLRLVMDQPLKLVGPAAERYMGEVQVGQPVKIRVDAYGDEIFDGLLSRVNPTVDPATRTFQFEVRVENREHRLKAGGFAKVGIFTRIDPLALSVPLEAVVSFAGVNKVFVVEGNVAHAVEVRLGVAGRGWVELTGALQAGQRVVTSGQSRLVEGSRIRVRQAADAQVAERAR